VTPADDAQSPTDRPSVFNVFNILVKYRAPVAGAAGRLAWTIVCVAVGGLGTHFWDRMERDRRERIVLQDVRNEIESNRRTLTMQDALRLDTSEPAQRIVNQKRNGTAIAGDNSLYGTQAYFHMRTVGCRLGYEVLDSLEKFYDLVAQLEDLRREVNDKSADQSVPPDDLRRLLDGRFPQLYNNAVSLNSYLRGQLPAPPGRAQDGQ
jgi:hypothetical protein